MKYSFSRGIGSADVSLIGGKERDHMSFMVGNVGNINVRCTRTLREGVRSS